MYRVGFPFWKVAARRGVPVLLRVEITRDEEAGVYVGRSHDLDGLVVEAATLDELRTEALSAAETLLELALTPDHAPRTRTEFRLIDGALCAA
jgi:predicted RNase H-like HicB family nuclease